MSIISQTQRYIPHELKTKHQLIRPRISRPNGKVKRSHRND